MWLIVTMTAVALGTSPAIAPLTLEPYAVFRHESDCQAALAARAAQAEQAGVRELCRFYRVAGERGA